VFRLVAIGLGLLPFAALEVVLRIAGVGGSKPTSSLSAIDSDPLVDLHSLRPLFVKSDDKTAMEIGTDRMNYFCPTSFPIEKAPNALRVFALGGSTTQGQPYRTETAFPQWLALRLEATMPGRKIEMINCGGISYASYRVAAILDEVLTYSPDLILLYTGHNEFLEARTYDRQRSIPRWLAGPLSTIASMRISRVAASLFSRPRETDTTKTALPTEVDTLLDHPDGLDAYVQDSDWADGVHEHFATTLASMVSRCQAANVPLVMCVPASDLVNTPPFKSLPALSLDAKTKQQVAKWTEIVQSETEDASERRGAAMSIVEVDPNHAFANYVLGKWAYETGDGDKTLAIQRLIVARDADICPLRATSRIVDTVRSYQRSEGVFVVDVPEVLDRKNAAGDPFADGVSDPHWFVDHVHPNGEGHQAIAASIYERLLSERWLKANEGAERVYAELVEAHLKTLGEEYYGRALQRLEGVKRWSRR